jgi:mxaK protein
MSFVSRRTTRGVWLLLAVAVLAAAADAALWLRDERRNAQIASASVPADATGLPPAMLFAQAHALAANGDDDAALKHYGALQDDTPLEAARYNSANLLMRQAVALRADDKPGQALALIELAKEHYRDVLRHDPGYWNARYNLERAQRLVPDPEESDAPVAGPQRSAERAATTMRGYSPGLP